MHHYLDLRADCFGNLHTAKLNKPNGIRLLNNPGLHFTRLKIEKLTWTKIGIVKLKEDHQRTLCKESTKSIARKRLDRSNNTLGIKLKNTSRIRMVDVSNDSTALLAVIEEE